jgi:Rod binding domain-containing protein
MASTALLSAPGLSPLDMLSANAPAAGGKLSAATKAKAKQASQDFEAVFVNQMFQHMFSGIQGEGPFGGNGATGVWRSFLVDEYSKTFVKAGGIGLADTVYKSLLAQQEARQ